MDSAKLRVAGDKLLKAHNQPWLKPSFILQAHWSRQARETLASAEGGGSRMRWRMYRNEAGEVYPYSVLKRDQFGNPKRKITHR